MWQKTYMIGNEVRTKRRDGKMAVTLISGFLGSGKTSLMSHILKNKDHKIKCAVIVNEISEFNIDADTLQGSKLIQQEEKVVEMSNGCVCCTLREDLLEQLADLHSKGFEAALIEASGISEPMQTAQNFFFPYESKFLPPGYTESEPETVKDVLQNYAPLDNCVTVVDASRLIEHMSSFLGEKPQDDNDISKLMFEQLEFANVVLLNKIDTIPRASEGSASSGIVTVESLTEVIKQINPFCKVIPTEYSKVPITEVLQTDNFTPEFLLKVKRGGWANELADLTKTGLKSATPETEEYGVSSLTITFQLPFHPKKLYDWLTKYFVLEEETPIACGMLQATSDKPKPKLSETEEKAARESFAALAKKTGDARKERYGDIFRGKGFVWLGNPTRLPYCAGWAQAGSTVNFSAFCAWKNFPSPPANPITPGQRLVFIGKDLKKDVLRQDLEECILTISQYQNLVGYIEMLKEEDEEDQDELPEDMFPDPFKSFLVDAVEE